MVDYKKRVGRPRKRGRKPAGWTGKLLSEISPFQQEDVEVISRRSQPQPRMQIEAPALKKQDIPLTPVASSWIAKLGYDKNNQTASMETIQGDTYEYDGVPFEVMQGWYYAMSKGTYFHEKIRGIYSPARKV